MASGATATKAVTRTDNENVLLIMATHTGAKHYLDGHMSYPSMSMKNTAFLGSSHVIFLSSRSTMEHEAPACIAAHLVHMVAKEVISLGMNSKTPADKVTIFAPQQLSISAKHVKIGNVKFAIVPKAAFITCKKLTLAESQVTTPDFVALVKSWLVNDDTIIEAEDQLFDTDFDEAKR